MSGITTFSGSLNFHLCGPIATGNCQTGGTAVAAKAGVNPVAEVDGNYDSADATGVTRMSSYFWRADYTSNTTGVLPNTSDPSDSTSTTECFTVTPVQTTLDTQAVAAAVNFGQPVQDNATLGNTASQPGSPIINGPTGSPAGGKITFTLVKADCTTLATGTGTNPQDFAPSTWKWDLRAGQLHARRTWHLPLEGGLHTGRRRPEQPGEHAQRHLQRLGRDRRGQPDPNDDQDQEQSWIPNDTATVAATSGNLGANEPGRVQPLRQRHMQ